MESGNINRDFPDFVDAWPSDSSWLKYHIRYCVEKNKYFVYPYTSFTTYLSDAGEHTTAGSSKYQVPMEYDCDKKYDFVNMNETESIYDSFFENESIYTWLGFKKSELIVDLYGQKSINNSCKYLLTEKKYKLPILNTFDLNYRPHEMNIKYCCKGNKIFLYQIDENIKCKKDKISRLLEYQDYYYGEIFGDRLWFQKAIRKLVKLFKL